MRVLMTGATGFVGSRLALRLMKDGHRVTAWVRDPRRARERLGADVQLVDAADEGALDEAIATSDAVVNLAGAPVATRWTRKRLEAIRSSRLDTTRRLVQAMQRSRATPQALVSASAIGIYGDRGDTWVDTSSDTGTDDMARLCVAWEAEALRATSFGVRVAIPRIGIVLGTEGGALGKMLPPFRAGLGGVLGGGGQWMSWIHVDDLVELLIAMLIDRNYRGVYDAVAPAPVTNRVFTKDLGRALGRPTALPIPSAALRLAFGGAATVMLASQRVAPTRLLEQGFRFAYSGVREALADLTAQPDLTIAPVAEVPPAPYLEARRPTHCLEQVTRIEAPVEEVFDFFSRAENLGPMTPPGLAFQIKSPTPIPMEVGTQIRYRIGLGPVPLGWHTEIMGWEPGRGFVDAQLRGPYRCWYHEHRFEADGRGTVMTDRVYYAVPLGPVGRLVNRIAVASMLRRIFDFRRRAIAARFGLRPRGDRGTDNADGPMAMTG